MNGQLTRLQYSDFQFIVNFTIHQQTNDINTLKCHLENFYKLYHENRMDKLEELTADARYGSEQNYELLEQKNITPWMQVKHYKKMHESTRKTKTTYPQKLSH